MTPKKKDLEIIYNLQWKHKPANGGDKANIIGMYDIPATTLKWDVFKSYLLKNSGMLGEDIQVSYMADAKTEFLIDTQNDFQIALYAFRSKARNGEIVNLKLDKRTPTLLFKKMEKRYTHRPVQCDNTAPVSTGTPPEWFVTYMNEFKTNVVEEVNTTVSNLIANIKPQVVTQQTCYHTRKAKQDNVKRVRRLQPLPTEAAVDNKELMKSLKIEGKLERKLEKLEHKSKKIKERKYALFTKSSDSDGGYCHSTDARQREEVEEHLQMNAEPSSFQDNTPRMYGGGVYTHTWLVKNSGLFPWTSDTNLTYTWGSKALSPIDNTVKVPYLKPGEQGTVVARLMVPHNPGKYECYWHFTQKGRRFGHWLGLAVIVEEKPYLDTSIEQSSLKSDEIVYENEPWIQNLIPTPDRGPGGTCICYEDNYDIPVQSSSFNEDATPTEHVLEEFVRDLSTTIENIKIHESDRNCNSDTDNQSVISISDSNSSKVSQDGYVMIPSSDCCQSSAQQGDSLSVFGVESDDWKNEESQVVKEVIEPVKEEPELENMDNNNNSDQNDQNVSNISHHSNQGSVDSVIKNTSKSDIVIISMTDDVESDEYAYIMVDGQKVAVPKMIIKPEYLTEAAADSTEGAPSRVESAASSIEVIKKEDIPNQVEAEPTSEADAPSSVEAMPQAETIQASTQECKSMPSLEQPNEFNSDCSALEPPNDFSSHCSAVGSCFSEENNNSRRFIFPQNYPGYEILHPLSEQWCSFDSIQQTEAWRQEEEASQEEILKQEQARTAEEPRCPEEARRPEAPPLNLSTHDRNPFMEPTEEHVPNFQQSPREWKPYQPGHLQENVATEEINRIWAQVAGPHVTALPQVSTAPTNERNVATSTKSHILSAGGIVSGAVTAASSALNTARSVMNMVVPTTQPRMDHNMREANLGILAEMGFWNIELNATLLDRFNDNIQRVVGELL